MDYDKKELRRWARKQLKIAKRAHYIARLAFMSRMPRTPEARLHLVRINQSIMDKRK